MTDRIIKREVDRFSNLNKILSGPQGRPGLVWINGGWVDGTSYIVDNTISNGTSSYRVIVSHVASASTEPGVGVDWETVWELLAEGCPLPPSVTQLEAETGTEVEDRLWSPLSVWQAIIAWGAKATSIFKGILAGFSEAQSTLVFTSGAATLSVDTCDNIQNATITQNSAITTTGTAATGKSIRLFITHSGGPWTLSWSGLDLGMEGSAGDLETLVATYNGVAWVFYRAGVADVVV